MVPMLAEVVADDGVPVFSCGGFDSLTFKHDAAQRIAARDVPTVVCHVGDHDPSGVALFAAFAEDVGDMAAALHGGDEPRVTFHRVGVTEEQIGRLALPTAPPKPHDKRDAWRGGETVQVESMPPDVLISEVRAAVDAVINRRVWQSLVDREATARSALRAQIEAVGA